MNRYIAYFDVMGFTDYVYRTSHGKVVGRLKQLSDAVKAFNNINSAMASEADPEIGKPFFAKGIIFSDTVLFYSEGDTEDDLLMVLSTATNFMDFTMSREIPIKGALAHGEFEANPTDQIYCGRPLIDAYKLADETKCYAAVLHHSIEKRLPLDLKIPLHVHRAEVPMEKGNITHYFVNPSTQPSFTETLHIFYDTVSGSTRKYVDNTIHLYKDHQKLMNEYHQDKMDRARKRKRDLRKSTR